MGLPTPSGRPSHPPPVDHTFSHGLDTTLQGGVTGIVASISELRKLWPSVPAVLILKGTGASCGHGAGPQHGLGCVLLLGPPHPLPSARLRSNPGPPVGPTRSCQTKPCPSTLPHARHPHTGTPSGRDMSELSFPALQREGLGGYLCGAWRKGGRKEGGWLFVVGSDTSLGRPYVCLSVNGTFQSPFAEAQAQGQRDSASLG